MSALDFKARLHALLPACNQFTCGVTPTDFLVASMAAEPFHPHTCIQALVGPKSSIIACDKTDTLPTELCWLGYKSTQLFTNKLKIADTVNNIKNQIS